MGEIAIDLTCDLLSPGDVPPGEHGRPVSGEGDAEGVGVAAVVEGARQGRVQHRPDVSHGERLLGAAPSHHLRIRRSQGSQDTWVKAHIKYFGPFP